MKKETVYTIIATKLETLKSLVSDFQEKMELVLPLEKDLNTLFNHVETFDSSWQGEWGSDNYNVYLYKGTPYEYNHDAVVQFAERKSKLNLQVIADSIIPLKENGNFIRNFIETEFLGIVKSPAFEFEFELFQKIEKTKWGFSVQETISHYRPKNLVLYDYSIINRGAIAAPPHIHVKGEIFHLVSVLSSFKEFMKVNKQFINSFEFKFRSENSGSITLDKANFLKMLIENFHKICKQLENRYNDRSSLIIQDEYDVQDLMHSLLKLAFDDIRSEDSVPSFAGANSRVDFLLKNEGILIEAKMARKGLKDRQIGDELIQDIARYGQFGDYNRLICFIYDPKGYIVNPRGVESDLQRLSTENFIVEVYIRP